MKQATAVILICDDRKSMVSEKPSSLHMVLGKPVGAYVLAAVAEYPWQAVYTVGGDEESGIYSQAGTHAILKLEKDTAVDGTVCLFFANHPFIRKEMVREALAQYGSGCTFVMGANGQAAFCLCGGEMFSAIQKAGARQPEAVLQWAKDTAVPTQEIHLKGNAQAVTNRLELAGYTALVREEINLSHMENGVTLTDPQQVYIGPDVKVGMDTVIGPGAVLEGGTVIGKGCSIGQGCKIVDATIGQETDITHSVVMGSQVGRQCHIGPFAYIRPNCKIGDNVKIGDFVEVKNAVIGDGTKASHHTYVGDADVGKNINFGCGTITVNYDGSNKFRTVIEDGAFIGCNTNLVAPVKVEENAFIAAGSTITDDVPQETLAIARARQVIKRGWKKGKKK